MKETARLSTYILDPVRKWFMSAIKVGELLFDIAVVGIGCVCASDLFRVNRSKFYIG